MQRILLIDDDAQLGPPLAAYFARFDFQLDCALKPSLGLAQLQRARYDAAILDVMLPEMDGFAVCRAIRKDSDPPLIMRTARGRTGTLAIAKAAPGLCITVTLPPAQPHPLP